MKQIIGVLLLPSSQLILTTSKFLETTFQCKNFTIWSTDSYSLDLHNSFSFTNYLKALALLFKGPPFHMMFVTVTSAYFSTALKHLLWKQ